MDINSFKWGEFRKVKGYEYYLPSEINQPWQWNHPALNTLLEEASLKMGELNSFARLVPNIDLFIMLHVTAEAVVSSRIEGTQTNIDEALMPQEEVTPERKKDWQEVRNYTEAMNRAIKQLKELPLSTRMIKNIHKILMSGVCGEHKDPGYYRKSQNWIGGANLTDAVYIPPDQHHVNDLMNDLEKFIHNEEIQVPDLIRIGMIHYQFETIHPFLDGNGRIGRLLITLYLIQKEIMDKPLLYLSKFFERQKSNYYDNLTRVREKNDMTRWLSFFLIGVRDTAIESADALSQVLHLKNDLEEKIRQEWGRRAHSASTLLEYLFKQPTVEVKQAEKVCNLSARAAGNLVKSFEDAGILVEITGQRRNRLYLFENYLNIFRH